VREPDEFGVECSHQLLAFGLGLIKLVERDCEVAGDNDRTAASPDHDDLRPGRVPRHREESDPR
jgi:hypothetical protein